jgi:hypothetical protein
MGGKRGDVRAATAGCFEGGVKLLIQLLQTTDSTCSIACRLIFRDAGEEQVLCQWIDFAAAEQSKTITTHGPNLLSAVSALKNKIVRNQFLCLCFVKVAKFNRVAVKSPRAVLSPGISHTAT